MKTGRNGLFSSVSFINLYKQVPDIAVGHLPIFA
jgi:hypothetical protein